ncbi:MAG: hypothetical protein JWQ90_714 [Hydrocarboniphaga sp.]|uniref:hypothetical protein n=1 Tax=Hydrocarboniphaga sp. TaxID=2033016 RepID=UPI00262671D6|nr:hypothetical protein [Hydrocarboniphaga sp.]MDB5968264.1 hypothetical protein [Hydrocarboniphaga sp.]
MFDLPCKRAIGAAALLGATLLTACGGGGSDSSTDPTPASTTITGNKIAGPLDPVQTQLSTSVFIPLTSAVTGTPLQAVVQCSDAIVNGSALDIADTVLVALQAAAANPGSADPAALADSLRLMVVDLTGLLQGLAGQTSGCTTNTLSLAQLEAALHALDGTPLAPLSTQLEPVLAQIIATIGTGSGSGSGSGTTPSLATLATLVAQLNAAMQTAIAQIPASAYSAPIAGGALTTVATALSNLSTLLTAATNMDAAGASTALQALVTNAVTNLLTQVVPLTTLESQSGSDALTAQIASVTAQLQSLLGGSVGTSPASSVFGASLLSALTPLLSPIETLLPTITGPIMDALAGGTASGGTGGALAGTALAPVVNIVSTVLGTLAGGTSGTGSCAFAGIPLLAILCGST